jgi:predicted AAA+ superfamily ATPase
LIAYVNTYLREEIQAEALVRKFPAFSRFLMTAALTSGQILNFTSIASDAGVPVATVREYYQILEDTFVGFLVPGWMRSIKRKALSSAKFYFFDIGVRNTLAQIKSVERPSELFGQAFEHFIALELRAYLSYRRKHLTINYWRTQHGQEVDFIIDKIAIEIKTSDRVIDKHLQGLRILAEEKICERYILISFDPIQRQDEQYELMHWQYFLKQLWSDRIFG